MKRSAVKTLLMRLVYAHSITAFVAATAIAHSYYSIGYDGSFQEFIARLIRRDGVVVAIIFSYLVFLTIFVLLPAFRDRRKNISVD